MPHDQNTHETDFSPELMNLINRTTSSTTSESFLEYSSLVTEYFREHKYTSEEINEIFYTNNTPLNYLMEYIKYLITLQNDSDMSELLQGIYNDITNIIMSIPFPEESESDLDMPYSEESEDSNMDLSDSEYEYEEVEITGNYYASPAA